MAHHRLHQGLWLKAQADSPQRKAGRRPARAGYVAGLAHHSCSPGDCTRSGQWVVPRPPASPAPRSAGCSASPSTQWSPGRCQTCCQLGRTKARLRRAPKSHSHGILHKTRGTQTWAHTQTLGSSICFLLQNKDSVMFPDHGST